MRGSAIEDFLIIWAIRVAKEGSGVFGKKIASSIDRLKRQFIRDELQGQSTVPADERLFSVVTSNKELRRTILSSSSRPSLSRDQ